MPKYDHEHKCPACGHIWGHNPWEIRSDEENVAAHTCSKCGTEQWWQAWVDNIPSRSLHQKEEREAEWRAEDERKETQRVSEQGLSPYDDLKDAQYEADLRAIAKFMTDHGLRLF